MMGDDKRHVEFAKFVARQWPRVGSILVVADGKAELARVLCDRVRKVRVVEAKPRLKGRPPKGLTIQRGWFAEGSEVTEDLIVGMHPDEATSEIILAARRNHLPWAVVPCCIKGRLASSVRHFSGWLNALASLDRGALRTLLPIRGKNMVLWHR